MKVFACHHPAHESTTIDDCLRCPDYDLRLRRGETIRWAVGVTTAPRREPTLERCLASLERAGWYNYRVFAEPDSLVSSIRLGVTRREAVVGAWSNWFLGLAELYQREPHATAYLMVQDDVVFCRDLRSYLEQVLWPAESLGVVSLYNPLSRADNEPGFENVNSADGLPGALALAFPNLAARHLLTDPHVLNHRRRGSTTGTKLIDIVVGQWAHRSGLKAYGHSPSLVQHIGDRTTLWGQAEDLHPRRAASFVGESFDALSFVTDEKAAPVWPRPLGLFESCTYDSFAIRKDLT